MIGLQALFSLLKEEELQVKLSPKSRKWLGELLSMHRQKSPRRITPIAPRKGK